jgi:hypothetical protein
LLEWHTVPFGRFLQDEFVHPGFHGFKAVFGSPLARGSVTQVLLCQLVEFGDVAESLAGFQLLVDGIG